MQRPVIGIPADRRLLGSHWFHCVGEKYIAAIIQATDAVPVLLPATGEWHLDDWLAACDAILFPGSASNVEPQRYRGEPSATGTLHDPERDATTLPLIPRAVAAGLPVFGICRGFQEMNVAYGGTLAQRLHEEPGRRDHRENASEPLEVQYGPAHELELSAGGLLERLAGQRRVMVNSVHAQGVARLGAGLTPEARADDGLIEAFRVTAAPAFALAVQWHPEWKVMDYPFSRALFAAFGTAARERAARRLR